jgi:hypothetical protein
VLLVSMFALKWYGADGVPRRSLAQAPQYSLDAWSALSGLRWLLLATVLAAFAAVAIHLGQRSHGAQTSTALPLVLLGAAASLALIWRVLIDLPMPAAIDEAKVGALIGLLSAIGVWLGGLQSLRAGRRAAGQPGRRAAGQPGRRAAGQPGRRAGGQPGRRAGGQPERRPAPAPAPPTIERGGG